MILYYLSSCPFCQKVFRFMQKEGIELKLADVTIPENRQRLIDEGGKYQVPCLFIDGSPLYESEDIIAYLRDHNVR